MVIRSQGEMMKHTLMAMLLGCLLWAMPSRSLGFREALWPSPVAQLTAALPAAASSPVSASAIPAHPGAPSLRQVLLAGVITVCFLALRRLG
jgi:hypothetical protein